MHPLLFKIGSVPVYTYGFMIALGFIAGVLLNRFLARRAGLDPEKVVDFSLWGMAVGLLGARVFYVITRMSDFLADPGMAFRVWEGGFVFYGGPLAVIAFGIWYLRRHRMNFWNTSDVVIHGLVIGHILGRFGCVGAGCCYGKPTGGSWGLRFYSELVPADLRGIPLHPAQLYEIAALIPLLGVMLWVFFHRRFQGQVLLTYLLAYPIIRSIVEIYRGDLIRGFVIDGILSTSQFISILVFVGAFIALKLRLRQLEREGGKVVPAPAP